VLKFDDFPEAKPRTPIPIEDKPEVGSLVYGRKVLQVKPVIASFLLKSILDSKEQNKEEIDKNLLFNQHATRPFVFWCVEVE
jgi:hypothetical protein